MTKNKDIWDVLDKVSKCKDAKKSFFAIYKMLPEASRDKLVLSTSNIFDTSEPLGYNQSFALNFIYNQVRKDTKLGRDFLKSLGFLSEEVY